MKFHLKKVERIAEIETDLNFTLYGDKKMGAKNIYQARVLNGTSFIPAAAKERWLEEALGNFTSSIIIKNWKLPAGAFSIEATGAN